MWYEEAADVQSGVQAGSRTIGTGAGVSIAQAARDLEVHPNLLRLWIRAIDIDPVHAFPGVGQQKPEAAELTRLRREVARLKMERDILEKAAAYFAKESM